MTTEVIRVGAWYTGSVRPDLWTAGQWDQVWVHGLGPSGGAMVEAFIESRMVLGFLARSRDKGLGEPGTAEAAIIAGLVLAEPWTY